MKKVIIILTLLFAAQAQAYDWHVQANVTRLEPTYAPNVIYFQLDAGAGNCPAGNWLRYYAKGTGVEKASSYEVAYDAINLALTLDREIKIYGLNTGPNYAPCYIDHIHSIQ